jgi:hypothetical protein
MTMRHPKTINYAHNLLSIRHAIWDSRHRNSSKPFWLNSALWESQFWTSSKRFVMILLSGKRFVMILLSGKINSEAVRIVFSAFCSLGESILNQFETFRRDSALWETQFWSSSNCFFSILLSWTVKAEPVRTDSSGLCSLGQLILKQFELICLNSALWDSQFWTSSKRFVMILISGKLNSEAVRTDVWILLCGTVKAEPVRTVSSWFFLLSETANSEAVRTDVWILLSGTIKAEPVRTVSSGFFLLSETASSEAVRTDLSEFCSLGRLILKQFELFCLNSALRDSQGWTISTRFFRALLSGTVKAEPVRTVSSGFCSIRQ